ncbi:hypothetical protein BGZ76_001038 [Entomortierella beljakovae]|nr:hypothetical protein BGZ76_001038 [Entomortierella beljakovae]
MTSVIPPDWSSNGIVDSSTYSLPEQGQYTLYQTGQQQQQQQQQQMQQPYPSSNSFQQNYQYQQFNRPQHQQNDLPRQLAPLNQEYDLNYPQETTPQSYQKRSSRDPTLRSKTSKRVSKSLPPDPLSRQRNRSLKNGSTSHSAVSSAKDLPLTPNSTSDYQRRQGQFNETSAPAELFSRSQPTNLTILTTQEPSGAINPIELAPYSPPPSKKGIPIERPYSYYKVAPKVPQSVTVIESPFGPPAPIATSSLEAPRNPVNGNTFNTYHTHPSQTNPFVAPIQYQPSQLHQNQQQQQQQQQTYNQVPYEERSRNDRPKQENTSSTYHSSATAGTDSTSKSSMNSRERSNSDNHSRMTTQQSDTASNHKTLDTIVRTKSRNDNGAQSGNQQSQHQERQQQSTTHADQEHEDSNCTQTSSKPTRKGSGSGFLKMARQASGTALRGMGLARKPSEKKINKDKASQKSEPHIDASYEQNSQAWSTVGSGRPQPELHQGQHQGQYPNGPPHAFTRTFDTELERNRSLPDFRPPLSIDSRGPGRGGSLTNPKTNPGPFHSRQKSQHQLPGTYQTATATSNEPFATTAISTAAPTVIQDAYGGTTDDWRQKQQAEKEARERQKLRDSSPKERSGHTSLNSVSTLNLPPTSVAPTTSSLGRSTSRILIPDRNRNHFKADQSSNDDHNSVHEPTQESTSLAKAAVQPGGILAQLQAATEVGQVIDPMAGKDGHYIQRANTAPFPQKEERIEDRELNSIDAGGSNQLGSLEYSKSEGYITAMRNNRQQQKHTQQHQHQQQQQQHHYQYQHQNQHQHLQQHSHQQYVQPETQSYDQQFMTSLQNQYYSQNDPLHPPRQQMSQQGHHQTYQQHQNQQNQQNQQRNQANSGADKDLPPTPGRIPQHSSDTPEQNAAHNKHQHNPAETGPQVQEQTRSRSGSHPESVRRQINQSSGWNGSTGMTSDSALALSRSLSPGKRASHERSGSTSQLARKGSNGQHPLSKSNSSGVKKEKTQYGIDMLPLPVIPSPDEALGRNTNVGILPQEVLKTLDPTTVQKVITQAVIASRVYKALPSEEIESLKKEQDDLQKYVEALKVSLSIETRMRDASHSLIKLHESNTNLEAVKAATSQLHATTRKMDQIVQKSHQSMSRLLVVQRLLLQHEGAVLNAGMRRLDGENRELGRAVQELETARDKEKEEKLKWKKEHSHLRIQSMIFPNPPGLEDYSGVALQKQQQLAPRAPSPLSQQNHQQTAQLAALEKYMKELNEDISKKDERIGQLESQLRLIRVWADDFSQSLKVFGLSNNSTANKSTSAEQKGPDSSVKLQKQLAQLQTRIEDGFRALEANAYELKTKAQDAELAKNKALEFAATTLANSSVIGPLERSSSNSSTGDSDIPRSKSRQKDQGPRVRSPFSRSKNSQNNSPYPQTHQNSNSDLNVVLNESLLELDSQLSSSPDTIGKGRQPRGEQQRRDSTKDTKPTETKDELVIGDAHAEIKRLNAMVDELERLVMLKMN